ncbi:hypothetical protein P152DRAFT_517199 [Eremomyces bilateralis CBS 781.70]|uniref:Amino acid permease/ SLC12A domain-containing protein n=1 Tax=Eremomyces bilateralis CBS 781.70 TaxID=1392243 RepID=A0A6G1FSU6_9PEZI|nr:uncharacterized protein P152DRAFT_517199 [Eremomyces bilateralis CBS 781.70]KAF1808844.1 hypothetical protein P152DRAFT_517199 [Eremomyces bilateralis CBS 781.70]
MAEPKFDEKVIDPQIQPPDYYHNAGEVEDNADHLQRHLGNRQIQLIAIGGSIGTALFVSINAGLANGGPASLFLAFSLSSIMLGLVNNCAAEMSTYMPVSGGFIRLAGKWVDDAFGVMAGWNFFLYEALLIPFEITAISTVLSYWRDDIPPAAVIAVCIVCYAVFNALAVHYYGESEFWLSGGKVILIIILFSFTFVTMVGGNPKHDAYGFRYWRDPGAFAEYRTTGSLGRFEGFLAALWTSSFAVVGPEYIAMIAAEAKRPRTYIKSAFKTVYFRFGLFFMGGALAVSIVLPRNDPTLLAIINGDAGGSGTASASPYVIAMQNLGVEGLPHLVNALLVTSIFSAGNTYTYCATRSLYGLALEGQAPSFFRYCTKSGVPIVCFAFVMCFPCLAFLQLGNNSATVLSWLVSLITAGGIINFIVICSTYLKFYYATKAQNFDRSKLPYTGYLQPWCGWIGLCWMIFVVFTYGYASFKPWSVKNFFINYTMVLLAPVLFIFWKLVKRTKWIPSSQVDLIWEAPIIDAYELTFYEPPLSFWVEMLQLMGIKRKGKGDRRSSIAMRP